MSKPIIFSETERDVLQRLLAQRLVSRAEHEPELFKNQKNRHYKHYVGSVKSILNKLILSDTCEMTQWERISCHSVLNGEYKSYDGNATSKIPYNKEVHFSILDKCKLPNR